MTSGLLTALAIVSITFASSARADDRAQACIDQHFQGQVLQRKGSLISASELFAACAAAQCPSIVRTECASLNATVAASIPTVVPVAVTASGEDLSSARVTVDDHSEPRPVTGRALGLDPGRHQLSFEAPGYVPQKLVVVLREGEKRRPVVARLRPLEEEEVAHDRTHPLVYAFGATGLVATGAWAYFGVRGLVERSDCADRRPCAEDVNSKLLIADISLGVGVVSLGAAAYFLFFVDREPAGPNARRSEETTLRLGTRMGASGAEILLDGQF